jgi:hypothetical protein
MTSATAPVIASRLGALAPRKTCSQLVVVINDAVPCQVHPSGRESAIRPIHDCCRTRR